MTVWTDLGIVAAALVSVLILLGIIWRKVVVPMRRAAALLRDIGNTLLGDDDPRHPVLSLAERLDKQDQTLADLRQSFGDHLDQHSRFDRPNGPKPSISQAPHRGTAR